jgi:hypothetical protein
VELVPEVELPPHPHPSVNRPTAKAKANLFIFALLPGFPARHTSALAEELQGQPPPARASMIWLSRNRVF